MQKLLFLYVLLYLLKAENYMIVNTASYSEIESNEKYDNFLLMFYDPKCPFCQRTLPEFSQSAEIVKNRVPNIEFGAINLQILPDLGTKAGITKVPTIYFYEKVNKTKTMIKMFTHDEIVNYLMNKFHIHAIEINNFEEATRFFQESENVTIIINK